MYRGEGMKTNKRLRTELLVLLCLEEHQKLVVLDKDLAAQLIAILIK